MPRLRAAIGSLLFLVIAPGTIVGLVPWWLTGWAVHDWPQPYATPLRLAGAVLIVLGVPALLHAFVRFVLEGIGTPAPVAPPEHLVVGGLYGYVRNPIYIALIATIVGQALVLAQPGLLLYAVVVAVALVAFVYGYEEPTLSEQFGAEYDAYRLAAAPPTLAATQRSFELETVLSISAALVRLRQTLPDGRPRLLDPRRGRRERQRVADEFKIGPDPLLERGCGEDALDPLSRLSRGGARSGRPNRRRRCQSRVCGVTSRLGWPAPVGASDQAW